MFNNSGCCYNRGSPSCLDDEDHMCKQMAAGYSRHTWVVLVHLLILTVYVAVWVKIHQPEKKWEKKLIDYFWRPKLSPVIEFILSLRTSAENVKLPLFHLIMSSSGVVFLPDSIFYLIASNIFGYLSQKYRGRYVH